MTCRTSTTDHAPVVVVGARNTGDVAAAVRWASRRGLGVGVHATGHEGRSYRGVVVVTTRRMTACTVDADARTATVGAGVRWEAVIAAAAAHGLAPLNGSSPSEGVVGYTLGGPVLGRPRRAGQLRRRHPPRVRPSTGSSVVRRQPLLRPRPGARRPRGVPDLDGGRARCHHGVDRPPGRAGTARAPVARARGRLRPASRRACGRQRDRGRGAGPDARVLRSARRHLPRHAVRGRRRHLPGHAGAGSQPPDRGAPRCPGDRRRQGAARGGRLTSGPATGPGRAPPPRRCPRRAPRPTELRRRPRRGVRARPRRPPAPAVGRQRAGAVPGGPRGDGSVDRRRRPDQLRAPDARGGLGMGAGRPCPAAADQARARPGQHLPRRPHGPALIAPCHASAPAPLRLREVAPEMRNVLTTLRTRKARRLLLGGAVAVAVLAAWGGPGSTPPGDPSGAAAVDYVRSHRLDLGAPGLAVGIVRPDGVTLGATGDVSADTPFVLGSATKSFTALAVLQLAEAGRLTLDTPAVHYVPDFGTSNPAISDRITVRQLLSHTSGISTTAGTDPLAGPETTLHRQGLALRALGAPPPRTFSHSEPN